MPNRFRSQFGENALKYFVGDCCGYSCSLVKFPFVESRRFLGRSVEPRKGRREFASEIFGLLNITLL